MVFYSWENRQQYINAIRELRKRELLNRQRIQALRSGLATIIPLQLLLIMSPLDMEMRTCGLPYVNIEFLKVTMFVIFNVPIAKKAPHFS
jgi:E3 ubiquitin-protein ligase HECTD4